MASTYLTRTPSSSGNLKTWTFSAWFKKGSGGYLFGAGDMSDGDPSVAIEVGTTIEFRVYGGGHISRLVPTQVTRDNSAWYHYVVAVDTTQGTASNRVKVYINGTQVHHLVQKNICHKIMILWLILHLMLKELVIEVVVILMVVWLMFI